LLTVEHLTIRFGGLVAVNDLNFTIEEGEIFGLIGPNGAGKTTCFNMISGALVPTSGKVILNGKEIQGRPMFEINSQGIARTYQNINLFREMTVLENVMVGRQSHMKAGLISSIIRTASQRKEEKEVEQKAREMLEFVGLNHRLSDEACNLSYGEQRLLEIARALASDPVLLLLDEPAAGMNPSEKMELKELVLRIRKKGITALVVEHDMKFVMNLTDRICVLNYGQELALGTPLEVQSNPAVVEAYLGGENVG